MASSLSLTLCGILSFLLTFEILIIYFLAYHNVGIGFIVLGCISAIVLCAYCSVVFWDPTLAFGSSSAAATCAYDPDRPPCWTELASQESKVNSISYYAEYHGHKVHQLARIWSKLKNAGCESFIYLCGDSSLDNKHWFYEGDRAKTRGLPGPEFTADAVNGYGDILTSPCKMVKDVCYHLNDLSEQRFGPHQVCTLMTSVEESTIADRGSDGLLVQDAFIREHITSNDYLIVSVGGNDIALRPTLRTAVNVAMLVKSPTWLIKSGWAPGLGYLHKLFHGKIQRLVRRVVSGPEAPKKILVCMIYYPDPTPSGSWADFTLSKLGYDEKPEKLQLAIRTLFNLIRDTGFSVPGSEVEAFPLFEVLSETGDYVQRVEPSVQGGRKMAAAFLDALF